MEKEALLLFCLKSNDAAVAEYCRRVREKLGQLGHEGKRLQKEALQIKIVVYPNQVHMQGRFLAMLPLHEHGHDDMYIVI